MNDKTVSDDSTVTSEQKKCEPKPQVDNTPKERLKGIINVRVGDSQPDSEHKDGD